MRRTPRIYRRLAVAGALAGCIFVTVGFFGSTGPSRERRERRMGEIAAGVLTDVLVHNTRIDSTLPQKRHRIIDILFGSPAPHSETRHLHRDDWVQTGPTQLRDQYGNHFVTTFDDNTQQWRVALTR